MSVDTIFADLMKIDSQNPDLNPNAKGEDEIAKYVGRVLSSIGADVHEQPVVDGRNNILGVLEGDIGEGIVVLEAHLDTVPVLDTTHPVELVGKRYYGRGACDTKASLAAMLAAMELLTKEDSSKPTVVLAGLVDEEYMMRGASKLLDWLPERVRGIIVGEPSSLLPIRANNGFIRFTVEVHGEAAHSSRPDLGNNAIISTVRVLDTIDTQLGEPLRAHANGLTGPAALSPTMIRGGIAPNVIPDYVEITFDRRVSPKETVKDALDAIDRRLCSLNDEGIRVRRNNPLVALPGYETSSSESVVVAATETASRLHGTRVEPSGVSYSTDACYLGATGTYPCVVIGPGSIDQAHKDEEWVDMGEVHAAVGLYSEIVRHSALLK